MMKKAFPLVVIAVLLVVFALWWRMGTQPQAPSTTFEECVAAGNPVMESYPRQCRDGNNTFVEDVSTTPPPVACTMEAKLCPDGSAVGRTGPNCEFAACPSRGPASATGTLAIGMNATIHGTTIGVLELMEDSRCPSDVQCIWAGTVRVRVALDSYNRDFTFTLGQPQVVGKATITLTAVTPAEKFSTQTVPLSDYRFTFTVSQASTDGGGGMLP